VAAIEAKFGVPKGGEGVSRASILGQCPNKNWMWIKVDGSAVKEAMKLPRRLVGKMDKKRVLVRPLGEGRWEWVKS
jgi:hypothetical protein